MAYKCKWHPHISSKGVHTKEECRDWHTRDLESMREPGFESFAGKDFLADKMNEAVEALKELGTE